MATSGVQWATLDPSACGGEMEMDAAPGSAICLSVCSASALAVAGSWCLAAAWSEAQPAALEPVASPFSIPGTEQASGSRDRQGDRGTCPPAAGASHCPGMEGRAGRGADQLGSCCSRQLCSGRGPAGGGGPRHPPPGTSPASPLLTALGGGWGGWPSSGCCRRRGRARRLPAAGPGGSTAAPRGRPPAPLPAASVGGERSGVRGAL